MSITVKDNAFTSSSTSEAPSTFVAGTVSFNGLVNLFGTTGSNGNSEKELGYMTVNSLTDWFSRLNKSPVGVCGPTGGWAGEWWAVHNYLQYGGRCVIGGTGSTGDYAFATIIKTNTPLHNSSLLTLDAVFDTGTTASSEVVIDIVTSRQDCLGVIGNYKSITGIPNIPSPYSTREDDFGFDTSSPYLVYVAGRKKFVAGTNSRNVNIRESNLSPDVAGCMARSARDQRIWNSPAGKTRGRILGVVSLQQTFSENDSNILLNANVNPIMTIPGQGTYLLGNKTSQTSGDLSKINISMMVSYLRKQLQDIVKEYMFELNNINTRLEVVSAITPILEDIKGGNGITEYRIVCDETNNTEAGNLVVDVFVDSVYAVETLQITIINSTTTESFVA